MATATAAGWPQQLHLVQGDLEAVPQLRCREGVAPGLPDKRVDGLTDAPALCLRNLQHTQLQAFSLIMQT